MQTSCISSSFTDLCFLCDVRNNVHSLGTRFLSFYSNSSLQRVHGRFALQSGWEWSQSSVLANKPRVHVWSRSRRWFIHLRHGIRRRRRAELSQPRHPGPKRAVRGVSSRCAVQVPHDPGPLLLSSWLGARVLRLSDGCPSQPGERRLHLHGQRDANTEWTCWKSWRPRRVQCFSSLQLRAGLPTVSGKQSTHMCCMHLVKR